MSDSKESQSKRSRNAAELLSRFHEKQAQRDENPVEVSAVHGACFVYHPEGSHSLGMRFWMGSTKRTTPTGDRSMTAASTTDIALPDVGTQSLVSPGDRTSSRKRSRKLFENPSFQNRVRVPDQRPSYWSLYMWNALKEWHTNPMSIPNALRDDQDGYFLEEDIDIAAWISKVTADISRSAFMDQMKAVFGSHVNFDTAFSGFNKNLLIAAHEANMWITDASTPLRLSTTIVKGSSATSQETKTEKLPRGPDFLALVLKHCALSRVQIYDRIIPYMIRHEEK
ncbi:hypothetical protein M422DRAFT_274595 [Sphaerobolus stellatus SS14]|uniref:Uncharacterized protein n=1 Tax=Sphaerobolus stellatus (strain SS14) TaxID=990650 RepID=A0A0C9UGM3_SPHS4|nr:hypothetical protein M422DRAFT_274595 [Sphaerobolus stellatus SS14]